MTTISQSYELGEHFACNCLDAEQKFISIMWHFPAAAHSAACDAGMTGGTFASDNHCGLFAYLGLSVEHGLPVNYTFFRHVADGAHIHITDEEFGDIVVGCHWDTDPRRDLPELASIIVMLADRRERAANHLRQAARLMRGQDNIVNDAAKPARVRVPHVRR